MKKRSYSKKKNVRRSRRAMPVRYASSRKWLVVALLAFWFGSAFLLSSPQVNKKNSSQTSVKSLSVLRDNSVFDYNKTSLKKNTIPGDDNKSSLQNGEVIFHGGRDKKQIALTFDADMTEGMKRNLLSGRIKSSYDRRIIEILRKTNTKATIFLTGMWIEVYPKEARELAQNPLFELANHSYSHPSFDGYCYGLRHIPDTKDLEEVEKTQQLLKELNGRENRYFRFPGGCYSQGDLAIVTNMAKLQVIQWDVKGLDGFNSEAKLIEGNVINNVQNGSIIVLHLNGAPTAPKTAEALPLIIETLKKKGFEFVKISELLE